ncbi:LmeA family phospholipid-binding protein [Kineococcus gypseus]|uniref:LmeA family phospholipid-binding protein n=1 Tax=Kineococcus gypseus TaxID=1637102 RepID=UPI003D7E2D33
MTRPRSSSAARAARAVRAVAVLVVLAVVLVGADLAARAWATGRAEREVQQRLGLPQRPEVTVAGGSFLLQVLRGRYEDVSLAAARVPGEDLVLDELRVDLPAVRAPLRSLVGRTGTADVAAGTFRADVDFGELAGRVDTGSLDVVLSRDGDDVRATTTVGVLGFGVDLALVVEPRLEDGVVRLVPVSARAAGQEVALGRARQLLRSAGVDLADGWTVALEEVPEQARVESLEVTGTGVRARGTVLASSVPLG